MKTITGNEFDNYLKTITVNSENDSTEKTVKEIINAVRAGGDAAVRRYASLFDRSSPETLEVPPNKIRDAVIKLEKSDAALARALELAAQNIKRFSLKQREQYIDFEFENSPGVFTGQKVIPVGRAAVYVPGGRFPLISSALMCLIPAFSAGVDEVCLASPPGADGIPDTRILAAAGIAAKVCGRLDNGFRSFAIGGAQAIAALALGTETIPRCDVVSGPGNKYVAAAKRLLFGETGIDFIAGPSDILVIMDEDSRPELAAADMLAQAEHDPDARARALVPNQKTADRLMAALNEKLAELNAAGSSMTPPSANVPLIAQQSLDNGGLIIIYKNREEAVKIANAVAPEHLELQVSGPDNWISLLKNYGSLFTGPLSAEVLGDYSAGLNHTLPTLGTSRFSSGLSVRYFLRTLTTLRCSNSHHPDNNGYAAALDAAETIARAEGLAAHAESARIRR